VTDASLAIPSHLRPGDGRFGSGPTKVRPEQLSALAATGMTYMGTSHRQDGVRSVVKRIRAGIAALYDLPEGYEVILGNGGATIFWDIATLCLIENRSQHMAFGEFSTKFAKAVAKVPFLAEPSVLEADYGQAPDAFAPEPGIDAYCLPHNETSTGVMTRIERPAGADDGALMLVDATSAAGALPVDLAHSDAYYFAPQKGFASDGGLFFAILSPAAIERSVRLIPGRWVPATLDLSIHIEQSRLEQTYNTPALATLFLMADQIEWMLARGGMAWASERTADSARNLYTWADKSPYAEAFVSDPAKRSTVVGTIRLAEEIEAAKVVKALRDNGIVDVGAYRAAGYNGLRVGMFPAIEPSDVEALTACIDWIVDRL
jgi:phosphoserine aminotransferase